MSANCSRRDFLLSLVLAGGSSSLLARVAAQGGEPQEVILSAQGKKPHQFGLGWISHDSGLAKQQLSAFRGHGMAMHPLRSASALMFGRRPATTAIEINLLSGEVKQVFQCASNRHLFGHGCFSADGDFLFTSEADYRSGEGIIGIRDSQTYEHLGEFSSHGIGPHEIKLMPDGKTLVVANGGLKTHPDSGRKKLNLESMASRLSYIDLTNGELINECRVPQAKSSIRHLDVAKDGTVAIATQVQREAMSNDEWVPLGAVHRPGEEIQMLHGPEALILRMQDYTGSVAINNARRVAGFTSPRGNLVLFWHLDEQRLLGYHSLHDVCGLAVTRDERHFVISNSSGQLRFLDAVSLQEDTQKRQSYPDMSWDNHLLISTI